MFEQRLWRGLLVARFVLPATIFTAIGTGALTGHHPALLSMAWLLLTVWTAVTTPALWSRLAWARRLPAPFWVEVGALAVLLCVGLGTRQWHILHFAIPTAFCSLMVSVRPTLVVCAVFVAAIWLARLIDSVGFDLPTERSTGPITPSVIFCLAAVLPMCVPRLFGDVRRLAAEVRATADSIRVMRRAEVQRLEFAELLQSATEPLARLLDGVVDHARGVQRTAGHEQAARGAQLVSACEQIEHTLGDMADPTEVASNVETLIATEVARARRLGWEVRVSGDVHLELPLDGGDTRRFRRLVREILTNACTHGPPPATAQLSDHRVEIANRAEQPPRPRAGHLGLANIEADARALGTPLTIDHADATVRVRLDLSPLAAKQTTAHDGEQHALQPLVARRRATFERILHAVRAAIALFTPISVAFLWQHGMSPHMPIFLATALVFLAWSLYFNVVGYSRRIVVIELAAILGITLLEGGYAGPWVGVAFLAPVLAALYGGAKVAGAYTLGLMTTMLIGAQAIAPDPGTPSPVVASLTLIVTCLLGIVIRWAFDRLSEATRSHDAAISALLSLERRAAALEARADAQREVHNSLLSLIAAASMTHAGIARSHAADPEIDALGRTLSTAHDSVRKLLTSLQTE